MATRILEFGGTGALGTSYPVVPSDHYITRQPAMTATASSVQSAALDPNTVLVLIQSDETVYAHPGLNPTSTNDSYRIVAGSEQFFSVQRNAGWKVAVKT